MDIVLVHAKLGALHHAMDGASRNTSVFVEADGFNITSVGCGESGSTKRDTVPVFAEIDRMLVSSVDGEVANQLVVRGSMK
jgi:hypothetical protein